MQTKTKITLLSCLTAALAVVCAVSFITGSGLIQARRTAYTWLDPKAAPRVSQITVLTSDRETMNLRKDSEAGWRVIGGDGAEYPAKQSRVEDLLDSLSKRASYPVRASSSATDSRLGISEDQAARITVKGQAIGGGEEAVTMLDLLVGDRLVTGEGVYLKHAGKSETRSGDDLFTTFTTASRTSWLDLRVFGDYEAEKMGVQSVQRLSAYTATDAAIGLDGQPKITIERSGNNWNLVPQDGETAKELSATRVETYIRGILDTTGEDFVSAADCAPDDPSFDNLLNGRVVLEYGNGQRRELKLGDKGESGTNAILTGADGTQYVYRLSEWSVERLFRKSEDLVKIVGRPLGL